MIRANPQGSVGQKPAMIACSRAFDAVVGHEIDSDISTRISLLSFSVEAWMRFSGTLVNLSRYFSFPWHGIQVSIKHQFHAHNFLQRLLLHEIKRLTQDPIQLELLPLPIQSQLEVTQPTGNLKTSMKFLSQQKRR